MAMQPGVADRDAMMEQMLAAGPEAVYEGEEDQSGEIIEIADKRHGDETYTCVTIRISPDQAAGLEVGMKVDLGSAMQQEGAEPTEMTDAV